MKVLVDEDRLEDQDVIALARPAPALDRDWDRCYDELSPHTRLFGRVYNFGRGLGSVVHG